MRGGYSKLRNGGQPLRLAYPIGGKDTFRPSGDPINDPPEPRPYESALESICPKTKAEQKAWDAMIGAHDPNYLRRSMDQGRHWERLRWLKMKSPRARKRAEERERKRQSTFLPR